MIIWLNLRVWKRHDNNAVCMTLLLLYIAMAGHSRVYISRRRAGDTARRSFARENRLFSPRPGRGGRAINGPAALSHGGGGDRHTPRGRRRTHGECRDDDTAVVVITQCYAEKRSRTPPWRKTRRKTRRRTEQALWSRRTRVWHEHCTLRVRIIIHNILCTHNDTKQIAERCHNVIIAYIFWNDVHGYYNMDMRRRQSVVVDETTIDRDELVLRAETVTETRPIDAIMRMMLCVFWCHDGLNYYCGSFERPKIRQSRTATTPVEWYYTKKYQRRDVIIIILIIICRRSSVQD